MNSTPGEACRLFGGAIWSGPDLPAWRLERKLAATLAYLALEGATHRTTLAGLLWPESPEATARNNLSQLLRKLRLHLGRDLLGSGDPLALSGDVWVDLRAARDLYTQGQYAALLELGGDVLQGLGYDDCPELDDWVRAQRERFQGWRAQALREEAERLERAGEFGAALDHIRALLDLDPVSEDAWRRVMRLHYLRGDRPAALAAYHRCQAMLRREFGTGPLPETQALAREIDQGTVPSGAAPAQEVPIRMLRPPSLVGREAEWARMETAWAAGQFICISGEPGSGKTRLAMDFATSRGPAVLNPSRPGDAGVPHATSVRNLRQLLDQHPELVRPDALPGWVRAELSRLMPEFGEGGAPAPPLQSEADKLRFFEAQVQAYREAYQGLTAIVIDDLQFMDVASMEFGSYMFGKAFPLGQPGGLPPILLTFRRGELPPETEEALRQFVAAGIAVLIELGPLDEGAVQALVADLALPQGEALGEALARYTGGNPLFLLETVRHLYETGQLQEGALPERLPLPPRVGELIERRLSRLSPPALQAARAAAVLQRDFDVELVAQVLGAPLFSLLGAWEELGAAQLVSGERFSHDLVAEAISQHLPASLCPLLHRGAARALEAQGAHPARIAGHWQEGGKPALAAPLWRRAAEVAAASFLPAAAAQSLGRSGDAFWDAGEADPAFGAWMEQAEALFYLEDRPGFVARLEVMEARASTPRHKGMTYRVASARQWMEGDPSGALGTAQLALSCAAQAGDLRLEAEVLDLLVALCLQQGYDHDLDAALARMVDIGEALHDAVVQAKAHQLLAAHLGERAPAQALEHARAGERLFHELGDVTAVASCIQKAINVHLRLGDIDRAREALGRKELSLAQGEAGQTQRLYLLEGVAQCDHAQGRYAQALAALEHALELEALHAALWRPGLRARRAAVLAELGADARALAEAREVLAAITDADHPRPEVWVLVLEVLLGLGAADEARAALQRAASLPGPGPYWGARLNLVRAGLQEPAERLPLLDALVDGSRAQGFLGVAVAAETRRNAARLALGWAPLPWEAGPDDPPAGVIGLPEWLAVRARVAGALGHGAEEARATLLAWVRRTAQEDVPGEYRAWFEDRARAALATGPGVGASRPDGR